MDHVYNLRNEIIIFALELYTRDCSDMTKSGSECNQDFVTRIQGIEGSEFIFQALNNII
jgi:hypothetical protein